MALKLRMTKRRVFWLLTCIAFIGAIWAGYMKLHAYWRKSSADHFRTASIRRGDIKFEVKSTGTVHAVRSVQVGAFVSGPIQKVYVDFNSKIKEGDILAEVDQRTYKSNVARVEATLAYKKADVERVKALLENAANNEKRALKLRETKKTFISETEVDQFTSERKSLDAQLKVAEAAVMESQAALAEAKTNLEFTVIKSPVDGIIIDKKVETGQTVASQFQTPVLFEVAPDLEKKIYVFASVDEADIGLIRKAELNNQPVNFSVDAYPEDTFEGKIAQVRLNPTTTQNVVTYTVVVESPNSELKLLPGMTTSLSFQIEKHNQILKIPNAALRFHPKPEQIHPQHRVLLEKLRVADDLEQNPSAVNPNLESDQEPAPGASDKQYVWVVEGEFLTPVEIKIGIHDIRYAELVSDNLDEGREVVTGIRTASETTAPQ
ncbi:MAG TPA: efflux RND transporter periplasmic adaptor subunit [Thermoguttaceae bacterium]